MTKKIETFEEFFRKLEIIDEHLIQHNSCEEYESFNFSVFGKYLSCIDDEQNCKKCPLFKNKTDKFIIVFNKYFIVKHKLGEAGKLLEFKYNTEYDRETECEWIDNVWCEYPLGNKFVSYEKILEWIKQCEE